MQPSTFSGSKVSGQAELNALASIGLSQYEGKCFLASLETGPATINQIGIVAGIPRTKVYGAIRKLVERGLLEQSEEDEKIFTAKSPREVLIPLLEKEEKRIKQGLDALAELEIIHQSMAYVKKADALRSMVLRLSPRSSVTRKTKEIFLGASKNIVVLTTANGLIRISKLAGILFERSRLGMKLKIYSSTKDEPVFHTAVQSLNEIDNAEVSLITTAYPIQVIVVDSKFVIFCEMKPDDMRDDGMDVAFFIESSELSEMVEALVQLLSSAQRSPDRSLPK
ncbi:MAG: TrmB family transcriptional regulator [Nitrososphaerales archaeon]